MNTERSIKAHKLAKSIYMVVDQPSVDPDTGEAWKPLIGFEGRYEISDFARIRSVATGKIIKTQITGDRGKKWERFKLRASGSRRSIYARMAKTVATVFLVNPEGLEGLRHLDGNLLNSKASNLEWTTPDCSDIQVNKPKPNKPSPAASRRPKRGSGAVLKETWLALAGFKGNCEISNLGRIRSLPSGNILKPLIRDNGQQCVALRPSNSELGSSVWVDIDQAVASAFSPNSNGHAQVLHTNDSLLNDQASNLKWSNEQAKKHRPGPRLIKGQKRPISVEIRIRPEHSAKRDIHPIQHEIANAQGQQVGKAKTLQARIRVEGIRDCGFVVRMPEIPVERIRTCSQTTNNYGSVLTIDPALWDAKKQVLTGRSQQVADLNDELLKIKLTIRDVFRRQQERYLQKIGPIPSTETVKAEYLTGVIPMTENGRSIKFNASIVAGFDAYYQDLLAQQDTELALSTASLQKRQSTRDKLIKFLEHEETPYLRAEQIHAPWAKRFLSWLMQSRRLRSASAATEVGIVRMALSFLVDQGHLVANPLTSLKLSKGKKKPVVWLSPEQVEALWTIDPESLQAVQINGQTVSVDGVKAALFWFKVITLTGMDYKDAVRYALNRDSYERQGIGGWKIVINRNKNGSECHIPISARLDGLLAKPLPKAYSLSYINLALPGIRERIGFEPILTTKVGRKTAGALWLLEGYTIHEISRFLGHSSIAMTEAHYVKTSAITADRGMQRINSRLPSEPKADRHYSFLPTFIAS